jgi:hypothetical protein
VSTDRLATLCPEDAATVSRVLAACAARGVVLRVTYAARSPQEQGRLWRQSRSASEVAAKIAALKAAGAPFLAACIEGAGPSSGPWATNALPGQSWHQWCGTSPGLYAIDVAWIVGGAVSWDVGAGSGYRVWREEATAAGMHRGPEADWAHMQGPLGGAPALPLAQIDRIMLSRWAS